MEGDARLELGNTTSVREQVRGYGWENTVEVLLAGMLAPRNLGADYAAEFDAIYPRLADRHRVRLYPFFLDGVALRPWLNQRDGIHPNGDGVVKIVERIAPHVARVLDGLSRMEVGSDG